MNEWLRIMLEEIRRKNDERRQDAEEHKRRIGKTRRGSRGGNEASRQRDDERRG